MPQEKKLVGVYGQLVDGADDHGVVTEFNAALVKKAVVKGYTLKSDDQRSDVFAVKGTENDHVEVEVFRFGPRGQAGLARHYDGENLVLTDVVATATAADGSTETLNISIYIDAGTAKDAEIASKMAKLQTMLKDANDLMEEIMELNHEEL